MLLATLLRRREELLVTTGPQLRVLLAETLSPSNMATLLAGGNGNADSKANSALELWCQEAEALDLATPESFRHHLALIGEIAEAEYEVSRILGIQCDVSIIDLGRIGQGSSGTGRVECLLCRGRQKTRVMVDFPPRFSSFFHASCVVQHAPSAKRPSA